MPISRGFVLGTISVTFIFGSLLLASKHDLAFRSNVNEVNHSSNIRRRLSFWKEWLDQVSTAKQKTRVGASQVVSLDGSYPNGRFGEAVALSGSGFLVAGSPSGGETGAGAVRVVAGINNGKQMDETLEGENTGDDYGYAVAVSPDNYYFAVGAPSAQKSTGAVYTYSARNKPIYFIKSLMGANPGDNFGSSLSMSSEGDRLVVGASGYIRLYTQSMGGWRQDYDFDGWGSFQGDLKVSMSPEGNMVAVGIPQNRKVQVYRFYSGNPRPFDPVSEQGIEGFGYSVAITTNAMWLTVGTNAGDAINRYELEGDRYEKMEKISGAGSETFGYSLSDSSEGDFLVVGDPSAGKSKLYSTSKDKLKYIATLEGTEVGNEFGYSVSLESGGRYFAIGAPGSDGGKGNVKVYRS